jgi:prepilin-type processing-associated H-X9-DG protein/prepilin-type N-terminal cleavage/methylation domain-containing protein
MRLRHAFTLVELLVVVGIIALLIALLFPVLSQAREAANRAKCLATLRSMAQAAHLHATDHGGYMPVAGVQSPRHLGAFATSVGVLDPNRRKYMYYRDGYVSQEVWRPVALPAALGHYMGLQEVLTQLGPMPALEADSVRRAFACPSQDPATIVGSPTITDDVEPIGPRAYMSYIFNGAALGRQIYPWGETPAGRLERIVEPTQVFLFADGIGPHDAYGMYTWFGYGVHPVRTDPTLADYWLLGGKSTGQFDRSRHGGRINIVFVDGHAETLRLPGTQLEPEDPNNRGELDRAGVLRGIALR